MQEVWEVVDQNYLDARGSGFDAARWEALRDEALAGALPDQAAAHRAVRHMLARGTADPYTRFVAPQARQRWERLLSRSSPPRCQDFTGRIQNPKFPSSYARATGL